MSKSIPAQLLAAYRQEVVTIAHAIRVTRSDGEVFAFTSADSDHAIDGVTYLSDPGLDVSNLVMSAGAAVGNLELTTLHDGTVFTTYDVLAGIWKNAAFVLFRYNYNAIGSPQPHDIDTMLVGTLGEVTLKASSVVAELRDLRQYLQQPVGSISSKNCRYRLGSTSKNSGGLCMLAIDGSPPPTAGSPGTQLNRTSTVTAVTSAQVFRDASCTEPDDWYGAGELTWLTGANTGVSRVVKSFSPYGSPLSGGEFTLFLPMLAAIAIGDQYRVTAGCRKRLQEDCRDKFNNVLNFGGEPHRPGIDALTQSPTVDV